MFCTKCGAEGSDDSQFCRKCGKSVVVAAKAKSRAVRPSLIVTLLLLIIIFGWFLLGGSDRHAAASASVAASGFHPLAQLHTIAIGNGAAAVGPLHYSYYKLSVPDGANNVKVQGHFTASGGIGNDVVVLLFDEDAFTNWQNGHGRTAIYNSGKITVCDLNANLTNAGTYYLVLSNQFSLLSAKAVQFNATMTYYQ